MRPAHHVCLNSVVQAAQQLHPPRHRGWVSRAHSMHQVPSHNTPWPGQHRALIWPGLRTSHAGTSLKHAGALQYTKA